MFLGKLLRSRAAAQMTDICRRFRLAPSSSSAVDALHAISKLGSFTSDDPHLSDLLNAAFVKEERHPDEVARLLQAAQCLHLSSSSESYLQFNELLTWHMDKLPICDLLAVPGPLLDDYSVHALGCRLEDWTSTVSDHSEVQVVLSAATRLDPSYRLCLEKQARNFFAFLNRKSPSVSLPTT